MLLLLFEFDPILELLGILRVTGLSYVATNFTDRGTRTSISKSVSDDGLTQTIVTSYPNEAAWNTFKTDLEVVNAFNTRKTYYTDNNITITITKTES